MSSALADNGGRRLFEGDRTPRRLELREASTSPAGTLFLHYRRTRGD